ncbi:MAG TPA: VOC family protein [Streptosporangiales bacterium]
MVAIVQVNVVVSDLGRSRDFYRRLGFTFRDRSRPGAETVEAWVSTGAGVTLVLHSPEFAAWWDSSTPGPVAGGSEIDLELDSASRLDAVVADLSASGATVAKPPVDMPWGQRFAVVLDPDGYRIGLKAPLEKAGS